LIAFINDIKAFAHYFCIKIPVRHETKDIHMYTAGSKLLITTCGLLSQKRF